MKKKLLILLLSMAMFVTMMPTMAWAESQNPCTQQTCTHEAAIGSVHYDTLEEAVAAATAGQTVEVLSNATLEAQLGVNKAITIDGNGKTITSTTETGSIGELAGILVVADATLKDMKVVGCKKSNKETWEEGRITVKVQAGKATIENVEFTNGCAALQVYGNGTEVTLNGTQKYASNNFDGIEVVNKGKLIVGSTAEFTTVNDTVAWVNTGNEGEIKDDYGKLYTVTIGKKSNNDKQYGVAVAKIAKTAGTTGYETVAAAVTATEAGDTVTLQKDVNENLNIASDKNLTIDLNGYSITSTAAKGQDASRTIINSGKLTIKNSGGSNGKVVSKENAAVTVAGDKTAELTILSGTFEGPEGAVTTGKLESGKIATGAKIKINGGTFIATDNAVIAGNGSSRTGEANEFTINGGTFSGSIKSAGYIACGIYAPWKDVVKVTGGTFTITNGVGVLQRAGQVTVTGGTFNLIGSSEGWVGDKKNTIETAAVVLDAEAAYPEYDKAYTKMQISGGKFSLEPTAKYIATNYKAQLNSTTGLYEVVPSDVYTVAFNSNGGTTTPTSQTVNSGELATKPADPTRTGYKLVGWYTTSACTTGTEWNFATPVTADKVVASTKTLTLYAKWEAVKYNVAFYKNDTAATGTMTTQQLTYGTAANLNANAFKKDGYVFAGWNTSSTAAATGTAYADKQSVINLSSTENATVYLYAQWKKQTDAATGGEAKADLTENVAINSTTKTSALTIGSNDVANIMKEVKAAQSTAITINAVSAATGAAAVTTADVTIPATFVTELVKTGAPVQNVAIATNVGTVSFDATALSDIATKVAAAKGTAVTVEIKKGEAKNDTAKGEIYQDYELSVKSNDTAKTVINEFGGGVETVTVAIPATLTGKAIGVLYVKDGKVVEGVKSAKGTGTVTFSTTHNSTYRLTTADSAAAAVKPLVNAATVAQSKLYAYKNGKIKVAWKAAEGYDVDSYRIYRSTKKSSGYKKVGEVKAGTLKFVNAKSLKKGTKYYYKVRGVVQLDNGKNAYTAYSNVKYIKCKKTVK